MAQITRSTAVALFQALGISSADKWNSKRMAAKLQKIDEMVDDDTTIDDKEVDDALTTCLDAIEKGEEVEVVADAKPAAKAKGKAATKAKTKAKPKKVEEEEEEDEEDPEEEEDEDEEEDEEEDETVPVRQPKKTKPKGKGKKAATKKEKPAPKKPSIPGVRETRTRPLLAGVVIKKHGGLKAGVTEEMVQELDELYGKENPAESLFTLRNAWHAIRGFQKGEDEADD